MAGGGSSNDHSRPRDFDDRLLQSIHEYWTPNSGWKWEKIYGLLPSHVEHLLVATLRQYNERTEGICGGDSTRRPNPNPGTRVLTLLLYFF